MGRCSDFTRPKWNSNQTNPGNRRCTRSVHLAIKMLRLKPQKLEHIRLYTSLFSEGFQNTQGGNTEEQVYIYLCVYI